MLSYREALIYLDSLINYEKKGNFPYHKKFLNLERTRYILKLVGNPHQHLKIIHIAGTKGKGSTAAMVSSILKEGGFKVGLFTSPHLVNPRERIRIGNQLIGKKELAFFVSEIKSKLEIFSPPSPPTFFEIYTAVALLYFLYKKVDLAVLEVGLGGRLDATNVANSLVAVITQISLDHTIELGKDLVSIAREKTGIIKEKSKVVISPQPRPVLKVIEEVCKEKKATMYRVGKEVSFERIKVSPRGQIIQVRMAGGNHGHLFLPLLGEHQAINAATAIGTIDLLKDYGIFIRREAVAAGLRKVKWPARIQVLSTSPLLILDCAHNQASAEALSKCLEEVFPKKGIIFVVGILKNKDVEGIGRSLCGWRNRVILTGINSCRALEPVSIKRRISKFGWEGVIIKQKVQDAIHYACSIATSQDLICVTGSVYLAGEVLKLYQAMEEVYA
ncbi:MAG: bifunctional folylpolyglutamate synthase/dihydrofolate synthase [bacterium]